MGTIVKVGQVWTNNRGHRVRISKIEDRQCFVDILSGPDHFESYFGELTSSDKADENWFDWHIENETHNSDPGGCYCVMCGNFFPYAVANRPSGKMVCWSCRQGWIPDGI